jgi:hypothetical protein
LARASTWRHDAILTGREWTITYLSTARVNCKIPKLLQYSCTFARSF